jgi:ABC-type multidrug transport system fused ATPase/permease subunit
VNSPLIILIYLAAIGYYIGIYMLPGLGVVLIFLLVLICISRICAYLIFKKLNLNDQRNKELAFILEGIQNVKLNSWEDIIQNRIQSIRNKEKKLISKLQFLRSFQEIFTFILPSIGSFVCIVLFNAFNDPMDLETAFFVITVFNLLVGPLKLFYFAVSSTFECIKSVRRIELILNLPNQSDESKNGFISSEKNANDSPKIPPMIEDLAILFQNADLKYHNSAFEDIIFNTVKKIQGIDASNSNLIKKKSTDKGFKLTDINLSVKKGDLIMIVGKVGCGKSSLLKSILDMLHIQKGTIQSSGSIAYIPQESFLINDRVRENIIFGFDMEMQRYKKAILLSELKPDLKILPGGEFTEIGEHGLNLSGGQKQRISIARAYYSDSDIYLIDDALSALDYHVGKNIFDNLIVKNLKENNKTVLMVTHLLQYLPQADFILYMEDGKICARGTYEELISNNQKFADFIMKDKKNDEKAISTVSKIFTYTSEVFDEFSFLKHQSIEKSLYDKLTSQRQMSNLVDESLNQLMLSATVNPNPTDLLGKNNV